MRHDPHHAGRGLPDRRLRDGRARRLHLRARRVHPRARALQAAIDEAYEARLIGKNNVHGWDFDLYVHHGAGAYICGEETALLESLEGKKGQPRLKPPFPANVGLYGCPTTVNNVEIDRGRADTSCAAARPGSPASAGRTTPAPSCSASPATSNKPCNVEEAMGIPFRELIETHCGGIRGGWDNLLAVIPGGSSVPLVPAAQIMRRCRWISTRCANLKSGLGTAAVIVMDKSTDIVRAIARLSLFLQARELRPVHAVPRGHRLDVARAGPHGGGPRRRSARSTCCSTSPSRSRATPSARSATPRPGRSRA